MYLSKLDLNTGNSGVYRLLADVYSQHRFVMTAFPDFLASSTSHQGAQSAGNILYRTETTSDRRGVSILVQSGEEPNWDKTNDVHPDSIRFCNQKEDSRVFSNGDNLRFRLRANPTVCRVNRDSEGNRNPKRVGLYKEEEQLEWLSRIGERHGFSVNLQAVLVTDLNKKDGYKPADETGSQKQSIKCYMVDYDGKLTVTDAEALHRALQHGIGRGKAWGCGLLSLAKA